MASQHNENGYVQDSTMSKAAAKFKAQLVSLKSKYEHEPEKNIYLQNKKVITRS